MKTGEQDHASYIKALIGVLDERVYNLKLFDKRDEINAHCDDLIGQVTLAVESAIEHLNKVQDGLIDEINSYRTGLIQATDGTSICESEDWKSLAKDVDALKHREASDQVVKMAEEMKQRDLRRQLRASTFNKSFMRFFAKEFVLENFLGKLQTSSKDTEDDLGFKNVDLDEMISTASVFDLEISHSSYSPTAMLYLPDGNLAISCRSQSIFIWSTEINQKLFDLPEEKRVRSLGDNYSNYFRRDWFTSELVHLPTGLLVSGGKYGEIDAWDLETRKHLIAAKIINKDGNGVNVLALRALQNRMLLIYADDGHVRVWNMSPQKDGEYSQEICRLSAHDSYQFYMPISFCRHLHLARAIYKWNQSKPRKKSLLTRTVEIYVDKYCAYARTGFDLKVLFDGNLRLQVPTWESFIFQRGIF